MRETRRPVVVTALLAALVASYFFLPEGLPRDVGYPAIGLVCILTAAVGLHRCARGRRFGWLLILGGFLGWVIGDFVFLFELRVLELEAYPAPSDAIYVASYGLLAAGLVVIVRRRGERGDLAAVLDAAILATGMAVVAGVFFIAPIAGDSSLSTLGKLTSSLYPIADVLLLGILVRLWTSPGARTASYRMLAAALSMTLLADLLYNLTAILSDSIVSTVYSDLLWLGSYALVAGAVWAPSVSELTEPAPGREDLVDPSRRLVVLTGGLLLPALTLLVDGLMGGPLEWEIVAVGSVLLSALVLSRMAGLLTVVRAQAVQLSALARSDGLTGVPNRRTWDHELSRACRVARETKEPLSVALLDLDHFKDYNDQYGHPQGDLLLRAATATWTDLLEDGEMLARYGGEEFAVLFPGLSPTEAKARTNVLLESMPELQTCSAGIALWDPDTDPGAVVAAADRALYAAKRAGRNMACIAKEEVQSPAALPRPSIFLQPIIDLSTEEPVAVEALSRFLEGDPLSVFGKAREEGAGPALEAAAISAALVNRPTGLLLSVNVGMDALIAPEVRAALAGDLTGVILEITEHEDIGVESDLMEAIADYRSRGAIIAIDDWGSGYSNLDRLLLLRPEIVKIDMSLVHGLNSEYHVATIGAAAAWAESVGARLCAEGIETEDQLNQLRELGVHLGQGFFLGRPVSPSQVREAQPSVAG